MSEPLSPSTSTDAHAPAAVPGEVQAVVLKTSDFILITLLILVAVFVVPKRIRKLLSGKQPQRPHSS